MVRLLKKLQVFLILSICSVAISQAAAVGPLVQVQESVDSVIATLKDSELGHLEKRSRIRGIIESRFDFETMARRILSSNWKKATQEEKKRFKELFTILLENTYMDRIEAYDNETVKYVKEKMKKNKAIVETLIVTKSVEIPIKYRMIRNSDGWYVYDVVIEEVSLVRNFRSSYREIVKKEGFDGLLKRLKEKIDEAENSARSAKK